MDPLSLGEPAKRIRSKSRAVAAAPESSGGGGFSLRSILCDEKVVTLFALSLFVRLLYLFLVVPTDWMGDSYHHWQIAWYTLKMGLARGRMWDLKGCEYYWPPVPSLFEALLMWLFRSPSILLMRVANTVFSVLVVTRYLPPLLKERSGATTPMAAAVALSMLLAGLAVPLLGALADRTGRSKTYLLGTTLACVAATAGLAAAPGTAWPLVLFFGANLAYQASMVFYNHLLPRVSTPRTVGTVSGLGVALGYAGSFLALAAAHFLAASGPVNRVFLLAAGGFLVFSLPLFVGVPAAARRREPAAATPTLHLLAALTHDPALRTFLLGNFFCLDAVNTAIVFYAEFLDKARGLSAGTIDLCLAAVQVAALVFSLAVGRLADRRSPKVAMLASTVAFAAALVLILVSDSSSGILIASLLGGLGLGGSWVAGRAWALELAPAGRTGAVLGLYGLTGKFSALGALPFGLMADHVSYDAALLLPLLFLGVGAVFLIRAGEAGT